uniref:Uncharacterized protein n=1 Tax=Oryza sativa subsp. japonica TaxID=39947 RepID=Q2R3X9_ORYSJ|nr:hypothetical protein LOC_Os11g30400 [Oryza sativa Japonica Group]
MAVATTSDGRCIRARDSADTLHGWRCGGWGGSGVVDTKKWTNKLPLGSPFTPSHFSEEQELNSSIYAAAFRRPLICHEQLLLSLCDGSLQVCGEFDRFLPQVFVSSFFMVHLAKVLVRKLIERKRIAMQCRFLPQVFVVHYLAKSFCSKSLTERKRIAMQCRSKEGGRWAAAGTARCHVAARAAGCRVSGGDAVPVHLPVDWLVLNGFLKRERGEHGVGSGGGRGRRQRWLVRQLRMRKQRHLDGLTAQVAHLRRDNAHVAIVLGLTTQGLLAVDAENAVLRT